MKRKSVIFALFISLFMLGGCVAAGPGYGGYGYYPPVQPYGYGYARPYYAPRTVIVAPARPYYGGGYHGEGGYHGGGRGGYHGRGR
ncbi:hypothetical protein [Hymenobacter rubidus]|uniref:hypothetical protein n=1 Tax=Hymenobacter rubidus TaxID=1441626 RepID=UPI00191DCC72|nr:hypothetical protein [Hymenobacter rubidus]